MTLPQKLVNKFYGGSIQDTARALGCVPQTIHTWLWNGYIPPLKALDVQDLTGGKIKALDILKEHRDVTKCQK